MKNSDFALLMATVWGSSLEPGVLNAVMGIAWAGLYFVHRYYESK